MQINRCLTYATVCSGIECMSTACADLPMKPVFFSEIEPFPCAVLKSHFPDVPNLGDMSKIEVTNDGKEITNGTTRIVLERNLDIFAGGTPCQDVSVAGKRSGMQEGSGTRSSLAFDFVRLVRELKPRYVLWENVAGVLSDKSFPEFLTALADCGYGVAYRTLDAQWVRCADCYHPDGGVVGMERAIPQRRRRVWVVGCAGGDVAKATEILFEHKSIVGDTPPRRRTGQEIARIAQRRNRVYDRVVGEASGDGIRRVEGFFDNVRTGFPTTGEDVNHTVCSASRYQGVVEKTIALDGNEGCVGFIPYGTRLGADTNGIAKTIARIDAKFPQCIALDGDKLKPRENPRKGGNGFGINEDGASYTLTVPDRHGVAYGIGNGQVQGACTPDTELSKTLDCMHDHQAVVECYENHAQDSRVKPIDVAPTIPQKAGTGGNNLPLAVFNKVSHARGKDGEGERWAEGDVASTRNVFDIGETRTQECVVSAGVTFDAMKGFPVADEVSQTQITGSSPGHHVGVVTTNSNRVVGMAQNTRDEVRIIGDGKVAGALAAEPGMKQQTYVVTTNSNGEDVMPTISACESKMGQQQKDVGGGTFCINEPTTEKK